MEPDRIDHHVGEIAEQGFTFVEDAIEPQLLDELRGTLVGLVNAPATKIARVVNEPASKLARVFGAYGAKEAA